MDFPASTGQVADLLDVAEPRLADLIRRRKIVPPPPVACGRRRWLPAHVRQAADSLGVLTADLDARLDAGALASQA